MSPKPIPPEPGTPITSDEFSTHSIVPVSVLLALVHHIDSLNLDNMGETDPPSSPTLPQLKIRAERHFEFYHYADGVWYFKSRYFPLRIEITELRRAGQDNMISYDPVMLSYWSSKGHDRYIYHSVVSNARAF